MADLTNLPSKLCRAIRYYLVNAGVVDATRAFHHFDSRERKYSDAPIVSVTMLPLGPEVQFTGDDEFRVMITVGFNAVEQPGDDAETQRYAFDAQVGAVRGKMMLSDDDGQTLIATRNAINAAAYLMPSDADANFAAKNADMADFTLLKLVPDTYGIVKIDGVNWAVGQAYRCTACERKVEGYI